MYENGKMRPVETIPGMGGGEQRRMVEGVKSTMIYCKNSCKCLNVPQYNNNIIKKRKNIIFNFPFP
jgi:hypothetical protein